MGNATSADEGENANTPPPEEAESQNADQTCEKVSIVSYGHRRIMATLPAGFGSISVTLVVGDLVRTIFYRNETDSNMKYSGFVAEGLNRESANKKIIEIKGGPLYYSSPFVSKVAFGVDTTSPVVGVYNAIGGLKSPFVPLENYLFLFGRNFGNIDNANITILIDNNRCSSASWRDATRKSGGLPYLRCIPSSTTVGEKQLQLSINNAPLSNVNFGVPLRAKCFDKFHGADGEQCVPCWQYEVMTFVGDIPITDQVYVSRCDEDEDPIALRGYSLWPPKECKNGGCKMEVSEGYEMYTDTKVPPECVGGDDVGCKKGSSLVLLVTLFSIEVNVKVLMRIMSNVNESLLEIRQHRPKQRETGLHL